MHVLIPLAALPLLAVLLSRLPLVAGVCLAILIIIVAGGLAATTFSRLTARLRWVWLSLVCVYLLFTPGEYVLPDQPWLWMTYEGLMGGSVQILHLLAMLAMVGYVLETYHTQALLAGLYQALRACRVPEHSLARMLARVALILQMQSFIGRQSLQLTSKSWQDYFVQPELLLTGLTMQQLNLQLTPLSRKEGCILLLMLAVILVLLVY